MTQEELRARCRVWQERLRLQDWDIDVRLARVRDLDDLTTAGDAETMVQKQCARIRVLDVQDPFNDPHCPYDPETTLVHELLHVAFKESQPECGDSPEWHAHERAIHRVSQALVNAYRGEEPTTAAGDLNAQYAREFVAGAANGKGLAEPEFIPDLVGPRRH